MLFFTVASGFNLRKNLSFLKSNERKSILPLSKTVKKQNQKNLISLKASEKEKENNVKKLDQEEETGNSIFSFIKEVAEETRMVEWPSLERLFKQFVIVVISLVLSAFVIYSVDGFFASLSQFLFEGKS